MTWEISHSLEAWENVRRNLEKWPHKELVDALVADDIALLGTNSDIDIVDYENERMAFYKDLGVDTLVNKCIARIEDHRSCSNGGHEFYVDRDGYYRVSVDYEEEDD